MVLSLLLTCSNFLFRGAASCYNCFSFMLEDLFVRFNAFISRIYSTKSMVYFKLTVHIVIVHIFRLVTSGENDNFTNSIATIHTQNLLV